MTTIRDHHQQPPSPPPSLPPLPNVIETDAETVVRHRASSSSTGNDTVSLFSTTHPLPRADEAEQNTSLLDIKNIITGQRYQVSQRRKVLHFLENWDHRLSFPIHQLRWHIALDYIVIFPALLFSAHSIPLLIFLSFFIVPLPVVGTLITGTLTTLTVTASLKKYLRRIRPGLHTAAYRVFNIRAWEKTNAMPSGDSAQAGLWCTIFAMYFQNPSLYLLVPCTQFGRVYFACHWVGDTIVGAIIGILIGHLSLFINTKGWEWFERGE
jgi:membrane-associated phospholipid phosphatase